MEMHSLTLAAVPVVAFAMAALSLPLMQRLSLRYGIVAVPYSDSRDREATPLLGGAAIVLAVLVALALAGALPGWLLLGSVGLCAVGVVDDCIALQPFRKLLLQVAVVMVVVAAAPDWGLLPWALPAAALAGLWLVATVNAFNLVDGLDGLAGGVGIVAALAVAAIGWLRNDLMVASEGLAIAGALGGFLIYNLHPASIFMGDCGALALGLLLGLAALQAGGLAAAHSRLSRFVVPMLIMLMPLLDTAIVSVSRMATGRAVSRRGLDHSHHRLLVLGLSEQRAVAVCWGVALAAGSCAVALAVLPHAYVLVLLPFIVLTFALVGLFMIDLTFDGNPPGMAYGRLQWLARLILNFSYKRRVAEATLDLMLVTAAYFGAFLMRLDFKIDDRRMTALLHSVPWVLLATYAAFMIVGIYRGMWRYASFSDVLRFANGAVLAGIFVVLLALWTPLSLSGSVAVLFVILLFNLLVASRLSFRALRRALAVLALPHERILIVGAGEIAEAAARFVSFGRGQTARLIGFVDDDSFKLGKFVHGYRVLGRCDQLEAIFAAHQFNQILIAVEQLPPERLALLWAFANRHRVAVRRFSIRVNDVGIATDDTPLAAEPAIPGQVVA